MSEALRRIDLLSAEDLFALDLPDSRAELIQGEVFRMTPAGGEHGIIAMRIGARLLAFVEAERLGDGSGPCTQEVLALRTRPRRRGDFAE